MAAIVFLPLNADVPTNRIPIANWMPILVIVGVSLIAWARPGLCYFLVGYAQPPEESSVARDLVRQVAPRVFNPPWWKLPVVAFTSSLVRANVLHLAGFVAGFLVARALASTRLVQPTRYEETLLPTLGIHRLTKDEAFRKVRPARARRWR
jgi:hypothetical protein